MDADQLYETTMNPETRMLKQVSIDNLIESNQLTQILMGTEVQPRKEYISEHARDAVIDS
jgi:DNA gyrase subunit B